MNLNDYPWWPPMGYGPPKGGWSGQTLHRLRGHTIVTRPMTKDDGPISVTVGRFGHIVPIIIDKCSCGAVW